MLDIQSITKFIYDPQWEAHPRGLLNELSTYHFSIPLDPVNPGRDRRLDVIPVGHPVRAHAGGDLPMHIVYVFVDHRPEESYTRVLYVGETGTVGRTLDYLYKERSSTNDPERNQFYRIIKEFATELFVILTHGGSIAGRNLEEKLTFALKPALYRNFLMATWRDVTRYRVSLPD